MFAAKKSPSSVLLQVFKGSNSRGFVRKRCLLPARVFSSEDTSIGQYLTSLGVQEKFHSEILKTAGPLMKNKHNWTVIDLKEALNPDDIIALSKSIELNKQQKAKSTSKRRPTMQVRFAISQTDPPKKATFIWRYGETLLDVAQGLDGQTFLDGLEQMEGACGGKCSCSTCHVYLDERTLQALEPPGDDEKDMLDMAYMPNKTSRLGCQVKLNDTLIQKLRDNVVTVTLPAGVNNQWDV